MTVNAHTRACNDCKLRIKTYQNVAGALTGFDRLLTLKEAEDHILLSSVFCFAVIKYAKSFIDNETSFGNRRYSIKHLKKTKNFSLVIHKHLMELRNTLVAHDDFGSIEPRIIQLFMSLEGTNFPIPMSIAVSNKCLAYPIDLEGVQKLRNHTTACLEGILTKLYDDLAKIREVALAHPDQATEGMLYKKDYGKMALDDPAFPDVMSNEWLNNTHPDFTHIHNGFRYEELRIRRDFHGPERIKLPNGLEIVIEPPNSGVPQD